MLWMGQPFNRDTPFRGALTEMAELLSLETHCSVELPAYEVGEDFVEGILWAGEDAVQVYYEHSLGYLSLSSERRHVLDEVLRRLRSILAVTRDGGERTSPLA